MAKTKLLRDPEQVELQLGLKCPGPDLKLGLGLDLGSTTGCSAVYFEPGKPWIPYEKYPFFLGQLDLTVGDYDTGVARFVRMRQYLAALNPDVVFFEDAAYFTAETFGPHPSVHQVVARVARPIELLGSFKCTLGTWCEERNIPCIGFKIQTIKKRATGKGNANKEDIIRAANEEFGAELAVEDYAKLGNDNIADSLYCLVVGLEEYSRGMK